MNASLLNGLNLYAYCGNNPIKNKDNIGTSWWTDFWNSIGNFFSSTWDVITGSIISLGMIVVGFALTFLTGGALYNLGSGLIGAGVGSFIGGLDSKLSGGSYLAGYLGGALSGGITGFAISVGFPILGGSIGHFIGSTVRDSLNGVTLDNGYFTNLFYESLINGLVAKGSYFIGNSIEILKSIGFRELFIVLATYSELLSSYMFEKTKEFFDILFYRIQRFIKNIFQWS